MDVLQHANFTLPPDELPRRTPIGRWCHDALDAIVEVIAESAKHQTAYQFLCPFFMWELNSVFLQGSAAMAVLCPVVWIIMCSANFQHLRVSFVWQAHEFHHHIEGRKHH